jgi:hypothetical protein
VRRGTGYLEMSMSLDGFVTGPNVSTEQPMGEGAGASVHDWMFSGKSDAEAERFERDDFVSGSRLTLQRPTR